MAARVTFRPERPEDGPVVEALVDAAFGPGRYAKAAERLREGNHPLLQLSPIAWSGDEAVGCVRLWPIAIGQAPGLLLGPIAVANTWRKRGVGEDLVGWACEAAQRAGQAVVLLVGDEAYFGRFGFLAAPARRTIMPGPVDRGRVLARFLRADSAGVLDGPVSGGNIRAAAHLPPA
ncbi:MAG TPA: N-acetyltransferase [Caulobacteraceae bacterium]